MARRVTGHGLDTANDEAGTDARPARGCPAAARRADPALGRVHRAPGRDEGRYYAWLAGPRRKKTTTGVT